MSENMIGINVENLDNLVTELSTICTNLSVCFDELKDNIFETTNCFKGDVGDTMRDKFKEFESQFPTVLSNLNTYIDDFVTLKNNHINFEKNIILSEVEKLSIEGGDFSGVNKN